MAAASEARREYQREWKRRKRAEDPARYRSKYDRCGALRRNYGISSAVYDQLLSKQGGLCALCSGVPGTDRGLVVDHDHATGSVRGLLCHRCNVALGGLGDTADGLRRALTYLEV